MGSVKRFFKNGLLGLTLGLSSLAAMPQISAALNINQQIDSKIAETFKGDPNVIGVGVIYLDTGEIMVSHPFKPEVVKNKRYLLAAVLTNITKATVNNLRKAGMDLKFANLRCKEGIFLIVPINNEVALVGFFTPNANVQEEKWHMLYELKPAVAQLLQ